MKWNLSWLMKQKNGDFTFNEDLVFDKEAIKSVHSLLDLKDVHVEGKGHYDQNLERVYIDLNIKGTMILECALSLEEVSYPFESESTEIFSFAKVADDEEEDIHLAKRETVDITPIVFQNIVLEVPLRVVKEGAKLKTEGKGWKVISEDEYEDTIDKEPDIDPRLAKLKDYFKDTN